jgi:glycosyltransferase involved in cell wall biosynthesis
MKISYQILCKNEGKSLEKLINSLLENIDPDDEINICRDSTGKNPETKLIINKYSKVKNINIFERKITHTIHNQKNWLTTKANGDYLFYLDADELLNPTLIQNLKVILKNNPNIDVYFLPRTNIVTGLKEEYRKSRGWKIDKEGRINWPDIQDRIFKNNGEIKYNEIPHGRLTNYKEYTILPLESVYAIHHEKTMEKQENDNEWHDNKERELGLR